jgi:cyclopropane fatty-acyl-phospholipid synthase-like methyltransferase
MMNRLNKPFSQACENNKQPILQVIRNFFVAGTILEIGSGTGQHAVYFAEHLPSVFWQTSDQSHYHEGINLWLDDYEGENLGRPLSFDVNQDELPIDKVAGIFSANTAHIMGWSSVINMFSKAGRLLEEGHYFCLYGPVNMNGTYTSDSNRAFDQHLKNTDPEMGIRDLEALTELAEQSGFRLYQLHQMPANNVLMVWQKYSPAQQS